MMTFVGYCRIANSPTGCKHNLGKARHVGFQLRPNAVKQPANPPEALQEVEFGRLSLPRQRRRSSPGKLAASQGIFSKLALHQVLGRQVSLKSGSRQLVARCRKK